MITQEELNLRLNKNGWKWQLVSNATPGIIRIQLSDDEIIETCWRKCIEAPTLQEALDKAEKFVDSINAYKYGQALMSQTRRIMEILEPKKDLMPIDSLGLCNIENLYRLYDLLCYVVAVLIENNLASDKTIKEISEWQGRIAAELGIDTPEG